MRTKGKRKGIVVFLAVELLLFAGVYFLGPQGLQQVRNAKKENDAIANEIEHLKLEIASLETTLNTWQHDPFYQEKIARERLQMARKNDEIYYLK